MDVPLPDFSNPPVVEVALSVQFAPLRALRTPQATLLWDRELRNRFPKIEEHAPLDPVVERFGVRPGSGQRVAVEVMQSPPASRCWFLNESGTELIQIQQDRLVHNWRKAGEEDVYPRYQHVRDMFLQDLKVFEKFVAQERLGTLCPIQCEVTYVNHIPAGRQPDGHGQLSNVLTLCAAEYTDAFLPEPEELRMSGSFVIPGSEGEPLGRLRFSVEPATRRVDDEPILLMNMVARGRPDGDGTDGVLAFLDLGRKWIVCGFAAITTRHMHKVWGRKQ